MSTGEPTLAQPAPSAEAQEHIDQGTVEETPEPITVEGRSKRYIQLHNAFQSAFRKANEKWTDEDCASCFPLLAEAVPHYLKKARKEAIDAGRVYATLEEAKVTKAYYATAAIDALHACILEGRHREKARHEEDPSSSPSYPNTWKPNMDPRASVRAHTVPLIRAELERLNHEIAEGEARNEALDVQLKANIAAQQQMTAQIRALLDRFHQTVTSMSSAQIVDLEQWAIIMEEQGKV